MSEESKRAYQEYLKSPHWASLRQRAKAYFGGCLLTGVEHFELHHLNYRNLGAERLWFDIIPLSPDLHREFHQYAEENGLRFHDILDWLKLSCRAVSEETLHRLRESQSYNRALFLHEIAPNSGAVNIYEEAVNPALLAPCDSSRGDIGKGGRRNEKRSKRAIRAEKRRAKRMERQARRDQKRAKREKGQKRVKVYPTLPEESKRGDAVRLYHPIQGKRKQWRDASWVKISP